MDAKSLKEKLIVKSPDLTRLLDRLVKKELVDRRTCSENRRKIDITVTEKGINLFYEMHCMLNNKGILAFIGYGVYLGEILAPFLLIIGYRIRLAALIISINMIIALLLVHSKDFFSLTPHGRLP